jgi:DNA (cytosine-5)-methyltransferase 1
MSASAAHRPKLLDGFCKAGGAGMGYHLAGFEVTGVDVEPQPRYPFRFIQADFFEYVAEHGHEYDLVHASPVCKRYTVANNIHGRDDHPDDIAAVREALRATGRPYVIENVPGAPLIAPVLICGLALGLGVKRHRLFESSLLLHGTTCPPGHPGHWVSVFGHTVLERSPAIGRTAKDGPIFRRKHLGLEKGREAMGIPWMTRAELSQAIPPAYTLEIGTQLRWHLEAVA